MVVITFCFSGLTFAQQETLTITTYYPSPYGSYKELITSGNTYLATDSGNVGIGTNTPLEKLHVNGNIRGNRAGAIRISTGYGYVDVGPRNTSYCHITTDRTRFYFNKEIRVNTGLIGSYDENLQLRTSGSTRMTILNSNGNVGIGTASPGQKLDVNGDIRTDRYLMIKSWEGTYGTGYGRLWYDGAGGSGNATGFLSIGDDTGNNRLVVQRTSGNVGIGTASPGAKLDVQGQIIINSTVRDAWGGWNDAIKFTNNNHAAIYFPSGGLLFGFHRPNRRFYWADTTNNRYVMNLRGNGNLWIRGTLTQGSSRKLKKEISYLSKEDCVKILKKLNNTKVITYRLKDEDSDAKTHMGVIAEEAPEEMVSKDKKSIVISDCLGFLMAAVKAQQEEISILKEEINRLKNK